MCQQADLRRNKRRSEGERSYLVYAASMLLSYWGRMEKVSATQCRLARSKCKLPELGLTLRMHH